MSFYLGMDYAELANLAKLANKGIDSVTKIHTKLEEINKFIKLPFRTDDFINIQKTCKKLSDYSINIRKNGWLVVFKNPETAQPQIGYITLEPFTENTNNIWLFTIWEQPPLYFAKNLLPNFHNGYSRSIKVDADQVYVIPEKIVQNLINNSKLNMDRYKDDMYCKELKNKNIYKNNIFNDYSFDLNLNYL